MSLEAGLYSFLSGQSPAIAGGRIYHMQAPQQPTRPYIVFQRVSTPRLKHLGGPAGRARPRVQFSLYANTAADVRALADQLRGVLDGYVGLMGDVAVGDTTVDNEFDEFEPQTDLSRVVMDVVISHVET